MPKQKISAKELISDIRAGMDDSALMKKHGLSVQGLQSAFNKLVEAKALKQSDLDNRVPLAEKTVDIAWKCPACGKPQMREFDECPDCGVIASKFRKQESLRNIQTPAKDSIGSDDLLFCPECGEKRVEEASFCARCGTQLGSPANEPDHRSRLLRRQPIEKANKETIREPESKARTIGGWIGVLSVVAVLCGLAGYFLFFGGPGRSKDFEPMAQEIGRASSQLQSGLSLPQHKEMRSRFVQQVGLLEQRFGGKRPEVIDSLREAVAALNVAEAMWEAEVAGQATRNEVEVSSVLWEYMENQVAGYETIKQAYDDMEGTHLVWWERIKLCKKIRSESWSEFRSAVTQAQKDMGDTTTGPGRKGR